MIQILSRLFPSWFAEVSALTWLGLALLAAVLEISLPHFGCMFISVGPSFSTSGAVRMTWATMRSSASVQRKSLRA